MNERDVYHVRTLKSADEVYSLRSFWEKWQHHPDAEIDHYLTVIRSRKEVLRPHVAVLYYNDEPVALYAGRLENVRVNFRLGYWIFWRPLVHCVTLVYNGLMGDIQPAHCSLLANGLIHSLRKGEADILRFSNLRVGSEIWHLCRNKPRILSRDRWQPENVHWKGTLDNSYEAFLKTRSKNTRRNLKRYSQSFEAKYGESAKIQCSRNESELTALREHCACIAAKTYQRGLGVGYADDECARQRLMVAARKEWLRGYVLLVREKPVAFWNGFKFGKTFYTDTTGYDPAYAADHVGTYLLTKMIQDLCGEGVAEIDFGFGDAQYKQDLCDSNWKEATVFVYASTPKGLSIKLAKTLESLVLKSGRLVLTRGNLYSRVKRIWRRKLTNHA